MEEDFHQGEGIHKTKDEWKQRQKQKYEKYITPFFHNEKNLRNTKDPLKNATIAKAMEGLRQRYIKLL